MRAIDTQWTFEGHEFRSMHDACVALLNGAVIRARVRRTVLSMGPSVDAAGRVSFECKVNDRVVQRGSPFDVAATFRALLRAMLAAPALKARAQSGVRPAVREGAAPQGRDAQDPPAIATGDGTRKSRRG